MTDNFRQYTCDSNLEVAGSAALSFVENLSTGNTQALAKKHGLDNIAIDQWYPLQKIFDFFNEVAAELGTQPFVAMGMKIAEQSEFPEDMIGNELSLQQILEGWQAHYAANHRGGDLAPVITRKVDDHHYQLELDPHYLYPYELTYGMAYGFCKLLLPKGTSFKVKYVDGHAPHDHGNKTVKLNITW